MHRSRGSPAWGWPPGRRGSWGRSDLDTSGPRTRRAALSGARDGGAGAGPRGAVFPGPPAATPSPSSARRPRQALRPGKAAGGLREARGSAPGRAARQVEVSCRSPHHGSSPRALRAGGAMASVLGLHSEQ